MANTPHVSWTAILFHLTGGRVLDEAETSKISQSPIKVSSLSMD
jgi:hypothetical protein